MSDGSQLETPAPKAETLAGVQAQASVQTLPSESFPFRPWVRSTCRTAMLWGMGVVLLFGVVGWLSREPGSAPAVRAFGVLAVYGLLFMASLAKIWWTAGKWAVVIEDRGLTYRPLHTFWTREIPWSTVLVSGPRVGTQSHRFVIGRRGGDGRELFLNLAVVGRKHQLIDLLGRYLEREGFEPVGEEPDAWSRPGLDL